MLNEFISTTFFLVLHRRWDELRTYFKLIKDLLDQPRAVITPGTPQPKDK